MIMSMPSTSAFLSGEESSRALYERTGRRFAYTPRTLRMPSSPLSGRFSGGDVIEFGQTHRAHQRGVGLEREVDGLLGQRAAGLMNRDPAEQAFAERELMVESSRPCCSTLTASRVTSVPIPSPGRINMFSCIS